MNADGSGLVRLTFSPTTDTSPAWSPDGQHIAYNQEYDGNLDVCVMHTDGPATNLTGWPGAEGTPTWSPDGTHIAFASDRVGNLEIYCIAADGTGPQNLTKNPASDAMPSWSPDGEPIAFSSDRHGSLDIYVLHLDSGRLDRLTTGAGAEVGPAWSPDCAPSLHCCYNGLEALLIQHTITHDGYLLVGTPPEHQGLVRFSPTSAKTEKGHPAKGQPSPHASCDQWPSVSWSCHMWASLPSVPAPCLNPPQPTTLEVDLQ